MAIVRRLEQIDLHDCWKLQYRPKDGSRGLTPDEFFGLTAYQLYRLLFIPPQPADKPNWSTDPVALLKASNEARAAKGLPPVIPPHVLTELPCHG